MTYNVFGETLNPTLLLLLLRWFGHVDWTIRMMLIGSMMEVDGTKRGLDGILSRRICKVLTCPERMDGWRHWKIGK